MSLRSKLLSGAALTAALGTVTGVVLAYTLSTAESEPAATFRADEAGLRFCFEASPGLGDGLQRFDDDLSVAAARLADSFRRANGLLEARGYERDPAYEPERYPAPRSRQGVRVGS